MDVTVRTIGLTRRGVAVVAIAVIAFSLGISTGARSLNAVVVPALVGLVAGIIQVVHLDPPTIERTKINPGFPDETQQVTVDVSSTVPCVVKEHIDEGLSPRTRPVTAAVGHGGRFTYDITYERRGEFEVGPAECRLTDSLGLWTRGVTTESVASTIVYPPVYRLSTDEFAELLSRTVGSERSVFDRLREYRASDKMHDIHWRASAKRPPDEFVVAEYQSHAETAHVTVTGEATATGADVMATVIASVTFHLLESGVSVSVMVPDGGCTVQPGDTGALLHVLATTTHGRLSDERVSDADIHVIGDDGRATASLGEQRIEFDEIFASNPRMEVRL